MESTIANLEWVHIGLVPNLIQKLRIESDPFPFYKPAWTPAPFPEGLGVQSCLRMMQGEKGGWAEPYLFPSLF